VTAFDEKSNADLAKYQKDVVDIAKASLDEIVRNKKRSLDAIAADTSIHYAKIAEYDIVVANQRKTLIDLITDKKRILNEYIEKEVRVPTAIRIAEYQSAIDQINNRMRPVAFSGRRYMRI
jgi:hypothetical protein